jgi:hypothetical protein
MLKEQAISILRSNGWNINQPDDIKVDEAQEDCIFLSQKGHGEWIVTQSGSVTFFDTSETDPNNPPSPDRFSW